MPTFTRRLPRFTAIVIAITAWAGSAAAAEIDTGNPDLTLRLDTTIRYNLGMRAEGQDNRILANSTYDESDSKFGRGDVVTNRLDLLGEFDLNWKDQLGVRVSAAGWYDNAYRDRSVRTVVPGFASSYFGNTYSPTVKRYVNGPSAEFLDAFVWSNFKLGQAPVSVKVGRHTNYWGEGLLFGAHAISYSQAPTDGVKAVTSPGIETKEVFLPLGNVSARAQLTSRLNVSGQYFFEWKPTRLPYGGTYFAPADMLFEGPDRLPVSPLGAAFTHAESIKPKNTGNWGVMARYNAEEIESTLGLYYRKFNDYQPWFAPQTLAAQGQYRLVYPKDVKLVGVSAARVIGPVSVGSELSYRMGGALNASGISAADNEGPRGNTLHAVVNGIYLLPKSALSDTGSVAVELAYSQLAKVTSHPELYKGVGYAGCRATETPAVTASGTKDDGCSSKHYLALAVNFTPQWLQVRPSWDMELPLSLNYGIRGNAASSGGGSEKSGSWSVGMKLTYAQRHEFSLRYADTFASLSKYNATGTMLAGGNGAVGTTDRGWLVVTYKTGF
ncbi:MAG: hypothetical protein JWP96_1844 [Polaromonas sp.]|nr:hypothetical protein [Polaromonas sp.]